jgi:hypothetical protein
VRVEEALADKSVDDRAGINLSSRVQSREGVVFKGFVSWQQELNIGREGQLRDNPDCLVSLLDGFVNVNDFRIGHLLVHLGGGGLSLFLLVA